MGLFKKPRAEKPARKRDRAKRGFSLNQRTAHVLDILSFMLGRTRSEIVDVGIARVLEGLSESERRSYLAAEAARDAGGGGRAG